MIAEFLTTTLLSALPRLPATRYDVGKDDLKDAGVIEVITEKRGCY
jgi:hypothetical protein